MRRILTVLFTILMVVLLTAPAYAAAPERIVVVPYYDANQNFILDLGEPTLVGMKILLTIDDGQDFGTVEQVARHNGARFRVEDGAYFSVEPVWPESDPSGGSWGYPAGWPSIPIWFQAESGEKITLYQPVVYWQEEVVAPVPPAIVY